MDGQLPAGQALPITTARLRIGDTDLARPVKGGDKAVVFKVKLKAGKVQLHTWFYDADGNELCGACYTEVRRK